MSALDGEIGKYDRWLFAAFRPHERVQVAFPDKSLARQEFKEESDINVLMARYRTHGVMPTMRVQEPRYLDVSAVPDFHTAMQIVIDSEAAFMTLPAAVRKEFGNDPGAFVEYASNPDNIGQMREWGLAAPEKAPEAPMRVEVVAPANDPGAPPSSSGAAPGAHTVRS